MRWWRAKKQRLMTDIEDKQLEIRKLRALDEVYRQEVLRTC